MATNLSLDPKLLEQALAVSGENPEGGRDPRPKGVHRTAHAKAVAGSDGSARLRRDIRLQGRALAPMSPFVDTSVWSRALRRDMPAACREVLALRRAPENGEALITTGTVPQELLPGFSGRAGDAIVERSGPYPIWRQTAETTLTRHSSVTSAVATESRWALLMRCPLRHASVMI